ncbi:MAG: 50S ribosomal protein L6 [Candidatus Omnitrophica bacterium]|nr:50S ribosomal protein L6 [Candidatus Omnitrophota bacterium]
MSRIGKNPVSIPDNVKVKIDNKIIYVDGPKGKLQLKIPFGIDIEVKNGKINVKRASDLKKNKSMHGTIRNSISNIIKGITEGYAKELEIVGVGYRAHVKGKDLNVQLGFSHPVNIPIPEDIKISVPKPTQIVIQGIDKVKVGQIAADIRMICPPEPYKGKGIRYVGEYVRKKQGKAITK